jgi:hypothetical protein
MSTVYIVSKSSDDAAILRRMLPPAIRRTIGFVVADDDPVAAISTARTLLALGGQPVGLVIDAYTRDATQIRSKRRTIEALLEKAAANVPWKLFIAVPDLRYVWASRTGVNQIPLAREIKGFVESVNG